MAKYLYCGRVCVIELLLAAENCPKTLLKGSPWSFSPLVALWSDVSINGSTLSSSCIVFFCSFCDTSLSCSSNDANILPARSTDTCLQTLIRHTWLPKSSVCPLRYHPIHHFFDNFKHTTCVTSVIAERTHVNWEKKNAKKWVCWLPFRENVIMRLIRIRIEGKKYEFWLCDAKGGYQN